MANEKEVIILNKPFLGGWLNGEGRIGHEIIDFFLADNGNYYVYNNPWGVCPKDTWVGDSEEKNSYGLKKSNGKNTNNGNCLNVTAIAKNNINLQLDFF